MKRVIGISLTLGLLLSCGKQAYEIININGNRIDVLGHGGMGYNSSFPLNSFESIEMALQSGANGTEMDIQLSKDSVLILYHDESLDSRTSGTGRIIELNWQELSSILYNTSAFDSYKLIRLEDVLDILESNKNYSLTLDCKTFPGNSNSINSYLKTYARSIKNLFNEYNLWDKVIIEASSIQLIEELKQIDSSIRILYYPENFEIGYQVATDLNLFGITISMHKINNKQIEDAHSSGLFVALWQVRTSKNNREAIKMNPDMIQSDKLKHLIRELE